MTYKKEFWAKVCLLNLFIVGLLGLTMRSKMLFSLKLVNFQFVEHAHSHFAFGAWVTIALLNFMISHLLSPVKGEKPVYQWGLIALMTCSVGMLISFIIQGYALYSIIFSTLFIFASYLVAFAMIPDLLKSDLTPSVKLLSVSALISLVISSAGPFTLAYFMATKTTNYLMYKDSIYTYLHFQYNGFFALGIFALLLKQVLPLSKSAEKFATWIVISILPSLFISYLWHFPNLFIRGIAFAGCLTIFITLYVFIKFLKGINNTLQFNSKIGRALFYLSVTAFILKSILQTGTIIPWLGQLVFGDRAIIIGYIHLVLLGFVTLFLLFQYLQDGLLNFRSTFTRFSLMLFTCGIILNESILMFQGFGNMLMISLDIYNSLLWGAAVVLCTGTFLIFLSGMLDRRLKDSSV